MQMLLHTRGVRKTKQISSTAWYQWLVGISELAKQSLYLPFHVLLRAEKEQDQIAWVNGESWIKLLIEYSV